MKVYCPKRAHIRYSKNNMKICKYSRTNNNTNIIHIISITKTTIKQYNKTKLDLPYNKVTVS